MISVLVVDDQAMIRLGIRAMLDAQHDLTVVGEARDGREAVAEVRALTPDVVLMDVRMPGMDGLTATRILLGSADRQHVPRVVMLTTFDIDRYVYEALCAGASGFLLKDSGPEELANAVRAVVGGESVLSPGVTRRLVERYVETGPSTAPTPMLDGLTSREVEVLTLVARGLSNSEIAGSLVIAEQTVKSHVSRIMHKLGLRDRVQAVVFGYENGLVTARR
jgi:DNA-binding NarL/FixJ family response regulator